MSNQVKIITSVPEQCANSLDELVRIAPAGFRASRNSMARAAIEYAMANGFAMSWNEPKKTEPHDSPRTKKLPMVIQAGDGATSEGARRLVAARASANMSQAALAEHLGFGHKSSVGNVELGRAPLQGILLEWVEKQESAS